MNKQIFTAITTALLFLSMAGSAMCLPSTFDWRDVNGTNYMTPAKDQANSGGGGCYVFAPIACVEAAYNIYGHPDTDLDLSEQYFLSCIPGLHCHTSIFGIMVHGGAPTEICYPQSLDPAPSPCEGWETCPYKIEGTVSAGGTIESFKQTIYDYGPISAHVSETHVACICGWDDAASVWIYKNSWGPEWGLEGYGFKAYGTIEGRGGSAVRGILKNWTSPVAATASSTWDYTGPVEATFDRKYEDIQEKWSSDHEVPCWVEFDMGEQMSIDAIYLATESPQYNPTTFNVSVSIGGSWVPVTENIIPTYSGRMFEVPINTTMARYIRLYFVSAYDIAVCYEFGVIETPTCPADISGAEYGMPDGMVDVFDIAFVTDNWGQSGSAADVSGATYGVPDDTVDVYDVSFIMDNWGSCV